MSESPDNLVLSHLRALRAGMDSLQEDVRDLRLRFTTLEQQVAAMAATEASHYAGLAMRLDRTDGRLDRIERRLDQVDAQSS